ncbi:MAG: hypothetical protein JSW34_05950 [Candidatus Zixiibacteriota bacterium]|nr:MAG: hypothetical protein JSW34_05950 [candidate division Zixibacteria bacterium]
MLDQQKLSGRPMRFLPRLAVAALIPPFIVWIDVLAILYWGDGILAESVHEFHNSLPAAAQLFLWLGLPLIAIALGVISLLRGYSPVLSRWVIGAGVIFAVLAILAAMRPA